jgi:hypothetical protein
LSGPPLPTNLPFFYSASGTWATPFQGLPFDVGWRVEQMGLVRNQRSDTRSLDSCTPTRSSATTNRLRTVSPN